MNPVRLTLGSLPSPSAPGILPGGVPDVAPGRRDQALSRTLASTQTVGPGQAAGSFTSLKRPPPEPPSQGSTNRNQILAGSG